MRVDDILADPEVLLPTFAMITIGFLLLREESGFISDIFRFLFALSVPVAFLCAISYL